MDNKVVRLSPRKAPRQPAVEDVNFGDRMLGAALAGIAAAFVLAMMFWLAKHL